MQKIYVDWFYPENEPRIHCHACGMLIREGPCASVELDTYHTYCLTNHLRLLIDRVNIETVELLNEKHEEHIK